MKRILVITLALFYACHTAFPQNKIWDETEEQKTRRLKWWTDARFGLFIHWGIYSQPARGEWVKTNEQLTSEEYIKYFEIFNPDLYDPREWARTARNAGMKYAIITTKHHDGFCLFNSKFTDYDALNTPYGKDLIKEWVNAFRAEGLGIGFYYSIIDWHHPNFTIDFMHPQRPSVFSKEEFDKLNKGRDMAVYREYMKNQVKELLTNYGKVDILWLDYATPRDKFGKNRDDYGSVELVKIVRQIQPGILINNRADLYEYRGGWDYLTPEQVAVPAWPVYEGKLAPWETCQTMTGSWGYRRDLASAGRYGEKSTRQLLVMLIETVSKGGNLLLNVGPTGRGSFEPSSEKAFKAIGEWMKYNSRSIYNCTQAPPEFIAPGKTVLTWNPETRRLYVHLLDYPVQYFRLPGFKGKVKYAQFLHDASELLFTERPARYPPTMTFPGISEENDLYLLLPVEKPDVEIPVIELILN